LVTLVGLIAMLILAIYELASFTSVELIESVTVDTSREQTIHLRFDISFPDMACKDVTIDLVDQNGNLQVTNPSNIQKSKISLPGNPLLNIPTASNDLIPADPNQKRGCLPCYTSIDDECCTCEEVKNYFDARSWITENPLTRPQCAEENAFFNAPGNAEGCRVKGQLTALKGSGNFHVAPGMATNGINGAHSHTMNPFTIMEDLQHARYSHTIHTLSFGFPYPGQNDTLNGVIFQTKDIVRHVYYIRLVPTIYIDGTNVVKTHQYSVTNHTDVVDLTNTFTLQLPGIFWKFDISPMLVKLERKEKYFTHFLTRLCAVVGGTWVVLGLLYATILQAFEKLRKKRK